MDSVGSDCNALLGYRSPSIHHSCWLFFSFGFKEIELSCVCAHVLRAFVWCAHGTVLKAARHPSDNSLVQQYSDGVVQSDQSDMWPARLPTRSAREIERFCVHSGERENRNSGNTLWARAREEQNLGVL